jgi:hypothetical protein
MNRYNLAVLSEAKTEYTNQLVNVLYPEIYTGIKSIYEAAFYYCEKNNDSGVLKKFQYLLSAIPKWNTDKINTEYIRVLKSTDCDWLEDLITAVFVSHTKVLASIKNSKKSKPISLDIPSGGYFLHKCYIETARNFWKKPYLLHRDYTSIDIQRNLADSEIIIKNSIIEAVRRMLPVKHILKEYLGNDYNDDDCNNEDITSTISLSTKNNLRKLVKSEIEQSISFKNLKKDINTDDKLSKLEIKEEYINNLDFFPDDNSKENKKNEISHVQEGGFNKNWVPKEKSKCLINSSSNGGWVEGEIFKIEDGIATVHYGDDYEKNVEINNRTLIKEFTKNNDEKTLKSVDEKNLKGDDEKTLKSDDEKTLKSNSEKNLKSDDEKNLKSDDEKNLKSDDEKNLKSDDEKNLKSEFKKEKKCLIFSNSNGGWIEGTIFKIEDGVATVYYGDDFEKEVDINDRNVIKPFEKKEDLKNGINFEIKKSDKIINKPVEFRPTVKQLDNKKKDISQLNISEGLTNMQVWIPVEKSDCQIFSNSNGGWVDGVIEKITDNKALIYYGDDYEKEVDLNDREVLRESPNNRNDIKLEKENIKDIKVAIENKIHDNKIDKNDFNKSFNKISKISKDDSIDVKVKKLNPENDKNNKINNEEVISISDIKVVNYDDNDNFNFFDSAPKF